MHWVDNAPCFEWAEPFTDWSSLTVFSPQSVLASRLEFTKRHLTLVLSSGHCELLGHCDPKAAQGLKDSESMRKKIFWCDETEMLLRARTPRVMSREHQALLITWLTLSLRWSMVKAASWGCFLAAGTGRMARTEGRMNVFKHREVLEENLLQSAHNLRLGRWFTFKLDNDLKHAAKTMLEWLRDSEVSDWPWVAKIQT